MYLQRAAVFASRRLSVSEILCLYPLDATEAELISTGEADAKLTMTGGDQTFRYPADGSLGSARTYGAAPSGFTTGTAETIDFSTGIKAVEFSGLDLLTGGTATSNPVGLDVNIFNASLTSLASIDVGNWEVVDTGLASGLESGPTFALSQGDYIYLLDETSRLGIYFDASESQYGITLHDADRYDTSDGTPYTLDSDWSGDLGLIAAYTPGVGSFTIAVTEGVSTGAVGDCGASLLFDARDMKCLYPLDATDRCGKAVDNYSLIESASLTRATPATRWTSAQLLEEVAADDLRLDHDPATGAVRGYLVEAGATRINPDVTDFAETSGWAGGSDFVLTKADSIIVGEDAWRHENKGAVSNRARTDDVTAFPSSRVSFSVIIENIDAAETRVGVRDQTDGNFVVEATFDWSSETLTTSSPLGSSYDSWAKQLKGTGPNGGPLWEINVSAIPDAAGNLGRVYVYPTGRNLNANEAVLHSAQYVEASNSSTILGNDSSASRDPDILDDAFTKTSGTLHIQGEHIGGDGVLWQADDTTEINRVRFEVSSGDIRMVVTDGGTEQAAITAGTLASDGTYNIAARFAKNDFAISIDGATAVTDTTGTVPTLTTERFGGDTTGVTGRNWYKRTDYRDDVFTNAQLEALSA